MYPERFGTVDQFVVKALRKIETLPETPALLRIKPDQISGRDGVVLIDIMRRKSKENNKIFGMDSWTPRKIDKVLWTYGR